MARISAVLVLATPLLLAGCGDGFYVTYVDGESCEVDFLDWSGGLTFHLLQGTGDGSFSYDPAGDMRTSIEGEYSLESGVFYWNEGFASEHWRTKVAVDGYGFADTNGDLDIAFDLETTDILGDDYSREVRYERVGCDVYQRDTYASGDVVWMSGEYTSDGLEYTTEMPSGILIDGVETASGITESYDYSESGYSYAETAESDRDGYTMTAWESSQTGSEGYDTSGTSESFLDGSTWHEYETEYRDGTVYNWSYGYDYEGDGDGSVTTSDGLDCDLTFENFECTYDCGGGSTGEC